MTWTCVPDGEEWTNILQKQLQFVGKCPFNELKR